MQVCPPAELPSMEPGDVTNVKQYTPDKFMVALRPEWVTMLEEKTSCTFDTFYNCCCPRKSSIHSPHYMLADGDAVSFRPGHALYFLAGHSAKNVLRTLSAYANYKLQHGQRSSACFILPMRTTEWNARVVHMKHVTTLSAADVQNNALDSAALEAYASKQARQQLSCNAAYAQAIMSQHRKWEIRLDSASANGHLLTSNWSTTIAGLPCSLLLDTGVQENFISAAFVSKHQFAFTQLSAGTIQLGNGSVANITGKVNLSLSIRNYHTSISMFVTELSEGIHVVLGEPFSSTTSAHIEYAPDGMTALQVWKGTVRFNLKPIIQHQSKSQEGPLLSAMQCKKAVKKAKRTFPVNVMHVMDTVPPDKLPTSQPQAVPSDPKQRHRLVS